MASTQAMILIYFFLVNDNHISDAWTFSGITIRQAFVLQLNRNPEIVAPHVSLQEKRLRIRLWGVISACDSISALHLKLPPSTTITDLTSETFRMYDDQLGTSTPEYYDSNVFPAGSLPPETERYDTLYVSTMLAMANLAAEHIAKPRSLSKHICKSKAHQRDLINMFYDFYARWPSPFGTFDPQRYFHSNERRSRQQIALSSNFFAYVMLIAADESDDDHITPDYYSTLEAAHEGLAAFFAMFDRLGVETNGWWAYQHRAFEGAVIIPAHNQKNSIANDSLRS